MMKWVAYLSTFSTIPGVLTFSPSTDILPFRQSVVQGQPLALRAQRNVDSVEYQRQQEVPPLPRITGSRRSLFKKTAQSLLSIVVPSTVSTMSLPSSVQAEVGTLPDFADTNFILQGMTVNVADLSQFDDMVSFLESGLFFKVLKEKDSGDIKEAWLGFGPEEMKIPKDFTPGVSSFNMYGGHASLHIRYDSKVTEPFYNGKGEAPGNNIAYFQVGVPNYRISQMVASKGNILDAYGFVNVVSPSGLPMRAIVGIRPDPIMFVAINTKDVEQSRAFYEQFGMVKQPYPYARPANGTGQFEPPQPPGSIYLAQTPYSMGVLLLPVKKKVSVVPNKVARSLNIVYNPTSSPDPEETFASIDPSQVGVALTPMDKFLKR